MTDVETNIPIIRNNLNAQYEMQDHEQSISYF